MRPVRRRRGRPYTVAYRQLDRAHRWATCLTVLLAVSVVGAAVKRWPVSQQEEKEETEAMRVLHQELHQRPHLDDSKIVVPVARPRVVG